MEHMVAPDERDAAFALCAACGNTRILGCLVRISRMLLSCNLQPQ